MVFYEIAPSQAKKIWSGKGNAKGKTPMYEAYTDRYKMPVIEPIIGMKPGSIRHPVDDIVDSIAIAVSTIQLSLNNGNKF